MAVREIVLLIDLEETDELGEAEVIDAILEASELGILAVMSDEILDMDDMEIDEDGADSDDD